MLPGKQLRQHARYLPAWLGIHHVHNTHKHGAGSVGIYSVQYLHKDRGFSGTTIKNTSAHRERLFVCCGITVHQRLFLQVL